MASIHRKKLRSGRVVWELTHGRGSERIRLVAGRTREEAEGVLSEFKRQIALHGSGPKSGSVEAVFLEYERYLTLNRRPSTTRRYVRVLKTFAIFLNDFHPHVELLRHVRTLHLEDYKRQRMAGAVAEPRSEDEIERERRLRQELETHSRSTGRRTNAQYGWLGRKRLHPRVGKTTINYEVQCLRTFFGWAVRQNYLFTNPATLVERLRVPRKALPKFLTSDDLRAFFGACDDREQRVFATILLTGMRRGEIEHLTWPDINFDLGVILIQVKTDEVGWQPKTDERIIPISGAIQQILLEEYAHRRGETWMFANRDGNRETHLLEKLKRVCRRAGIRQANLHSLRHSFGAHLRMAGVNLADIADLMGHKDLATTQIYAKVQQEHLRSVIGKLTPLVPIASDVSLKRVTRTVEDQSEGRKLLKPKKLESDENELAGRQGFEPRLHGPEPRVLPLNDLPAHAVRTAARTVHYR